jgi:tetratricopeptide (TPR) repeat protein
MTNSGESNMKQFSWRYRDRLWPRGAAAGAAVLLALAGCASNRGDTDRGDTASDLAPPPAFYPGFSGYSRGVTTSAMVTVPAPDPVSARPDEAQRWFNQGLQLLYGFNHDEAIRSFHMAAEADKRCAMAMWGVAYAHGLHINNPVMGEEASRLAFEAAQEAVRRAQYASPVEQALIGAVAQRYAWPAPDDRRPLDERYAAAMGEVYRQFPDDPDVGALYAEALMNLQPWDNWTHDGQPKHRTPEIVEVLEHVLAIAPDHPGANHFYIHAVEASPNPGLATAAAERLSDLVPGSGHLVHMPSHIFIRTGRYADAAESNQRAIAADERYFAVAPEPGFYSLYFMHNIHFLAYAAMMEGRYQTAMDASRKIEGQIPQGWLRENVKFADGFMPTALHVMVRFGRWDEILAEPEPPAWRLFTRAERHYARAVALANTGRTDEARQEIAAMDAVVEEMGEGWTIGQNKAEDALRIARLMAEGETLFFEGQRDPAFDRLRAAVALEERLIYDEPPGWMQPVRHALGALLMADGRSQEAEEVYRADLARHPNNAWSLLGLHQALQEQGMVAEARAMQAEVDRAWARADVPRPEGSCYCGASAREAMAR